MRAIIVISLLSALFLVITATTYASLGIVLPSMRAALGWSWAEAGLGFTVLALFTGLFSPVASAALKRLGARGNYAAGGAVMAGGFALLSVASSALTYLVATALLGAGFALLANVPSVYVVARLTRPDWRSRIVGLYFSAGGVGGIVGPLAASGALGAGLSWRAYWLGAAALIAVMTFGLTLALKRRIDSSTEDIESPADAVAPESTDWTLREALRAPAFYAISAALLAVYLCGVTVSSFGATQLQKLGHDAGFAGAILSLHAAANTFARAGGGYLAKRFAAKSLLLTALIAEVIGMLALAYAGSTPAAVIFAVCEGYAFGMALFATTQMQLDYFGLKHSPAILGAMNLGATAAMLGPVVAGVVGDRLGGFSPVFVAYAGLSLIAGFALLAIRQTARQ